ncbi:MAG: glycosyltransferase family 4 protein, partial [Gammaproteobacteria bacterium]
IACISQATEADVRHWLDALSIERDTPLALGHFHLGSETRPDDDASGVTQDQQTTIDRLHDKPSFLMVGTLEPRKGHAQTLEAFNQLWTRGNDVALVIVGLPGWMTEVVQRRIRHHDELGKRLFWFADASDALLEQLYAQCSVLLAPSQGEGFGLPLIEAARHGLPILCRDLPVFHEVAGEFARYFSGNDATSLAQAVESWLDAQRQGQVPPTAAMPRLTWAESAQQLLGLILDDQADAILTSNRRESEQT